MRSWTGRGAESRMANRTSRAVGCTIATASSGRPSRRVCVSSRRRHTRFDCDWSSDVCSSDLGVLVRTAWSLLSAGTERTNISGQRVVDRLRRQPEVVGKVWNEVRRAGLSETVKLVTDKMDRAIQLGNSLSGVVIEVGAGVPDLAVGDRVACGGTGHASHAEYVFVPRNLTVTVPDGLHSKDAAFVTLGAIALQGVRRANLQLGETAVVVGLGLIGLLTVQILRAAGV